MILVEQHIVKKKNVNWKQIDKNCFLSKNLYNYALYIIRQHFLETGNHLKFNDLDKKLRDENHENYIKLPNNTSQQILMLLDRNFNSFFKLIKKWKKNRKSLGGCPLPPKFKDKQKGRNLLVFTTNQFKRKGEFIHFPKKMGLKPIKTRIIKEKIRQVRIVPRTDYFTIEIVYEKIIKIKPENKEKRFASIDLGLNNLCAVTSDQPDLKPVLVNGRPLKSMNQFYNKKKAKMQSLLNKNQYTSKNINRLTFKRNRKIEYYLHCCSKFIVAWCIENKITDVIIGYNIRWKDEINIGKRNNQNFVNIPFYKLLQQISYKLEIEGIRMKTREESYTSKCSALDFEVIKKHEKYVGRRVKRGLFKTKIGFLLNADVNGSMNILRKEIGDDFVKSLLDIGHVECPVLVTPARN